MEPSKSTDMGQADSTLRKQNTVKLFKVMIGKQILKDFLDQASAMRIALTSDDYVVRPSAFNNDLTSDQFFKEYKSIYVGSYDHGYPLAAKMLSQYCGQQQEKAETIYAASLKGKISNELIGVARKINDTLFPIAHKTLSTSNNKQKGSTMQSLSAKQKLSIKQKAYRDYFREVMKSLKLKKLKGADKETLAKLFNTVKKGWPKAKKAALRAAHASVSESASTGTIKKWYSDWEGNKMTTAALLGKVKYSTDDEKVSIQIDKLLQKIEDIDASAAELVEDIILKMPYK